MGQAAEQQDRPTRLLGYTGKYFHSVDSKGRLQLPSGWRSDPDAGFPPRFYYLWLGQDGCIEAAPPERYAAVERQFRRIAHRRGRAGRDLMRFHFSAGQDVTPDNQGRISIPDHILEYAGLSRSRTEDRATAIVGVGSAFEIWSKGRFEATPTLDETTRTSLFDELNTGLDAEEFGSDPTTPEEL